MASILKVDTIQDQSGNNIINENADTITIGASGDTISIPAGATITNSGTATGFGDAVLVASASGGGTTVQDFNSCFSATYKFYMILANIKVSATSNVTMRFQDLSNTELSSGVHYFQGYEGHNNTGTYTLTGMGGYGDTNINVGANILSSNPLGAYRIFVYDPFTSSTKTNYDVQFTCQNAAANLNTVNLGGVYDSATGMAGFRFNSDSGNISSESTFRIYGFK
jgi:hypothetical protein